MGKIGIVGGAGYVAGELLRCLIHHEETEIVFVHSHSMPGKPISGQHEDLFWNKTITFSNQVDSEVDLVFLCLGHGNSRKFLAQYRWAEHTRFIDLSADFRLKDQCTWNGHAFVYGLVELNHEAIRSAKYVANPGCFATAIQLGLLPLAKRGFLNQEVHIHAVTGSTGAGQEPSANSHFSWRNNNLSIYKPFVHQHLAEISESLEAVQGRRVHSLNFLPLRGGFSRGIFASMYCSTPLDEDELNGLFSTYYHQAQFTHISEGEVHLKQVVNTNHCLLRVQKLQDKVLITSILDNLLKGAAGQAIQNMNIMFDLPESCGLQLKANYF